MKPSRFLSCGAACAVLALSLCAARADDPSSPPQPPTGGDVTPGQPPPPPPGENGPPPGDQAQPPPHPHRGRPGFVLADLTRRLNLTPDQQKSIGAILADGKAREKALRSDDSLSPEDRRARMMQILETERASIRASLTPDQQKTFDAMPMRGRWRKDSPPPPPATGPSPTPETRT